MQDILASDPQAPPNFARLAFLDSAAHRFHPDLEIDDAIVEDVT